MFPLKFFGAGGNEIATSKHFVPRVACILPMLRQRRCCMLVLPSQTQSMFLPKLVVPRYVCSQPLDRRKEIHGCLYRACA